jgi:sugar phosphate isomerase/epimerase
MRRAAVVVVALWVLILAPSTSSAEPPVSPSLKKTQLNQPALDKLGWKLGVQAYTFRKLSLFETIDVISAVGLKYIELYPGQRLSPAVKEPFNHASKPEQVDAVIKKLTEAGVIAVNYGVVGLPKDETESRKVFEFAKKMGLTTIVSEPPPDAFETIEKLVNEYHVNVAIHDHPKPSHYWNPEAVLEVCKGRPKSIGACADLGHWYRSGLVPLECLKKLDGRIICSHLKDLNEKKEDVPVGRGATNTKALLEEIKRQGTEDVVFSIEYEKTEGDELIANVVKCIEYFNAAATELAEK